MSDYIKTVNFAAKDSLPANNANKRIKGSEYNAEYDAIETAVATKADKVGSPVENNLLKMDSTGNLADAGVAPEGVGSLIDVQVFTSSGTWTSPSGCTQVIVDVIAGGGGSGGCTGNAAWTVTAGAGGAGAAVRAHISSGLAGTESVTVGAAGAAGLTTGTGGTGGSSSFGAFITCTGGAGGTVSNFASGAGASPGGAGGAVSVLTGTAAALSFSGVAGEDGFRVNSVASPGWTSEGGTVTLPYGVPAPKRVVVAAGAVASATAIGYGVGGAGTCRYASGFASVGQVGKQGVVVVRAYR